MRRQFFYSPGCYKSSWIKSQLHIVKSRCRCCLKIRLEFGEEIQVRIHERLRLRDFSKSKERFEPLAVSQSATLGPMQAYHRLRLWRVCLMCRQRGLLRGGCRSIGVSRRMGIGVEFECILEGSPLKVQWFYFLGYQISRFYILVISGYICIC